MIEFRYVIRLTFPKIGIEQSVAGSVINAVIGHITQQGGISNLFNRGSNYTDHDRIGGIHCFI